MQPEFDPSSLQRFRYERGVHRYKHCWKRDEAGFVGKGRAKIGKCHRSITDEIANALLRNGLVQPCPYSEVQPAGSASAAPRRIFNVYRGVIYVAVPTQRGRSYHGYPYKGRLGLRLREALLARAAADGYEKECRRWIKEHIEL